MADTTTPPTPVAPAQPTEQPVVQPTEPKLAVEQDEKFFAALGYIFVLFLLSLIVKPKSTYCKFHAKQSMILLLGFFVFMIVLMINRFIGSILFFPLFAAWIIAIYKAYSGEMWNIPGLSKFAAKMDIDELYKKADLKLSSISNLKEKVGDMASKATDAVKAAGKQEDETPKQPEPPATPPAKG